MKLMVSLVSVLVLAGGLSAEPKSALSASEFVFVAKDEAGAIFNDIQSQSSSKRALFPSKIRLVWTNGFEEVHTASCRGLDATVLPTNEMDRSSRSLEHTLAHDLLHILSRNNPGLKEEFDGLIGFRKASAP